MGNVSGKLFSCLLCLLLIIGMVSGVKANASDDITESDEFKKIYIDNFEAIKADYDAGYHNIALIYEGLKSSECEPTIVLSSEPMYLDRSMTSLSDEIVLKSGESVKGNQNFHVYNSSGNGWYYCRMPEYVVSNYDIHYSDKSSFSGKIAYNTKHIPDWFTIGNTGITSNLIPRCDLVSDYYNKEGNVVYYYYKDYPEYAFCTASDSTLSVVNVLANDETRANKYIGRVVDGKVVFSRGSNDKFYIFSAKLRKWQPFTTINNSFTPSSFLGTEHMFNAANEGKNFTIVSSNCTLYQFDFDTGGNLLSTFPVSTGPVTGDWSFPVAPVPELVGTVQGIMWSRMMTEIVGLIPLLVGLVISFLALRKGLAMLYRRLRKG